MTLQQLRYFREVVRRDLNISKAAAALHITQPGLSRQMRLLEEELGIELFVRNRTRLVRLSAAGSEIVAMAEHTLASAESIKGVSREHSAQREGSLTIATTHTQARYALPKAVAAFKRRYPKVQLIIHQGNPTQICEQVAQGEADLCVATEHIAEHPGLVALPCYQWNRCIVVPPRHPLLTVEPLTLEAVAKYPIVTYDFAYANRSVVNRAFEQRGLAPQVVLTAFDADVIKTYVELGLGVGIMAAMAFNPKRDRQLRAIDAAHLFPSSTTRLGIKRGAYLRRYAYDFIESFAPNLSRGLVEKAVTEQQGSTYEL